ncbi:hypothetical protein JDV02_007507 [Purpureocillium takamizusanense]|uniref:Uncharacterized protein n=1 Tax=Purpureocillium takamizusanense TaxID=2060973 RepID=A0A9Q8QMJ6_9HYPO|nr:uncharacterized protein JDV02_007507 [Purpureocillium takamizusanense]UNI21526.1 hypothetical protein JDV02_007507 [Purpureocillium takamizusanense]
MSSSLKNEVTVSDFEGDGRDLRTRIKARVVGTVHGLRVALTLLALLSGITILGLSANSLAVYKDTYVPDDYLLPLWPDHFDLRPTTALIAGSAILIVANAVSLLASKTASVRKRVGAHTSVSLAAPVIGFIAALVAMALFYAVNASATVDTMQSWTCRWKQVGMSMQPHFGSLCRQNEAGLILAILLVPLELCVLVTACFQMFLERKFSAALRGGASPAMS